MIYLDNAATTKCHVDVVEEMKKFLDVDFFNPSSVYAPAVSVRKYIENVRSEMLDLVCASNHKALFVSCATEANNLIFASAGLRSGDKILVSMGEHPSVFECAKYYQTLGINVEFVGLTSDGQVDFDDLAKKMTNEVKLVSVMMVSNETGAINNIKKIAKYAKQINPRVLVATDGVQAFGKIDVCIDDLGVDFFVASAHKIHGPKGVGMLVYRKDLKINPILLGGGQENSLRSGTENVAGIAGLFVASKIAIKNLDENFKRVSKVNESLMRELENLGIDFVRNGNGSPYVMSISFKNVRGEVLLHSLEESGILISTGSACSSKNSDNRILSSMGKSKVEVLGSVRISFNGYDEYDTKFIAEKIAKKVNLLKG